MNKNELTFSSRRFFFIITTPLASVSLSLRKELNTTGSLHCTADATAIDWRPSDLRVSEWRPASKPTEKRSSNVEAKRARFLPLGKAARERERELQAANVLFCTRTLQEFTTPSAFAFLFFGVMQCRSRARFKKVSESELGQRKAAHGLRRPSVPLSFFLSFLPRDSSKKSRIFFSVRTTLFVVLCLKPFQLPSLFR